MKMKLFAALLLLVSGAAQAVTLYLDNITFTTNNTPGQSFYVGIGTTGAGYINGYCPSCGDFSVGTLTGQFNPKLAGNPKGPLSTATISGLDVTLTDVHWMINNVFGQNYDLKFLSAQTQIGTGVSLTKTGITCLRFSGSGAGTTCADATTPPLKSGYGFGTDFTSLNATGGPCVSTTVSIGNLQCAVNVTYDATNQKLAVEIRKALSETSQGFQSFTLNYVVPVPGAVWLMLSAMGGLAALRRRVAA